MAPPVAYFDLLEDGLVQEVIRSLDGPPRDSWKSLASTCRRLCTLVRATRRVKIQISKDLDGLQHLLRLPRNRAFRQVRELSVSKFQESSVAEWARFTDAVATAAATWPMMEEVLLDAKLVLRDDNCFDGVGGCLSGPLMALRHAPGLRRLLLKLGDNHSLAYLPVLTQLTHLELMATREEGIISISVSSRSEEGTTASPLADMTNLVSLKMTDAAVEEYGPCALPPNLTRLEAAWGWYVEGKGDWVEHLAGCSRLQELQLMLPWGDSQVYPTRLIQELAGHLTGLVKVRLDIDDSFNEAADYWYQQDLFHNSPEEWGPIDVAEFMRLPFEASGQYGGGVLPMAYVLIPPPNLSALSSLQHLDVGRWWLAAPSEHFWRVLGGCSSLRSLRGLHASVPPPAGVTFPHLTRLFVTTSTSPGDTLALLGAFPALEELTLSVVPTSSGSDEPPRAPPVVMQQLWLVVIMFKWPFNAAVDNAACVKAYCTPLWSACPRLVEVGLQWPCCLQTPATTLQGHAAHRQQEAVALGAQQKAERGWGCNPFLPLHVEAGQLLPALQGATQLRWLGLYMELDPSSADQLVLGVQGALPGLRRLGTLDGAAGLAPATLAALRPGLMRCLIDL